MPPLAIIILAVTLGATVSGVLVGLVALVLAAAVLAAVHHAEVVAHRVGEPFGSLVLAVAVTVIEVALIVTLMVTGGPDKAALARDTVFAALMITCNGIVGMCLLVATLRGGQAVFNAAGTGAAMATITALATLSLVLPSFTTSTPGPTFSGFQLAFAAVASLVLYGLFVFVQTVRHRDFFLPPLRSGEAGARESGARESGARESGAPDADPEEHAPAPSGRTAVRSLVLLVVALVAVVGLAKVVSPTIETAVRDARLPLGVVGVVIALLVLLPESLAAYRAARRGRLQTGLNLAYGSAMASIGLTIPAIAVASVWVAGPLELGLNPVELVLLALTVVLGLFTVTPGRATLLQGGVHLTVFAGFLVLAVNP